MTRDGEKKRWDEGIVGVPLNGHLNMVNFWSRLGFVVRDAATDRFVEVDRTL